ncbi:hypothetical protein COV81_03835 [Candidatus Peregrinibacteria bacterium CG11_big_fil_rev_8_21_14_0_20_41_10]|nr:MAG: hypothetical protein COV81_03835 [Candidatus Peregrinibacteria bacterium CG11_big_fil_rev_8_21_14_0_20_41_10]PIZ74269.1 MAG: hypothetical protein COY06_04500 [Candidatus Peregrinibacteria bacterium CG_4_10_14_0_2_um_filter_41_8]
MEILIATTNKGKFTEMMEVLGDLPHQFFSLNDLNITLDVDEAGLTYAENALLKAEQYYEVGNMPTIGEDSGIVVDALAGELGIHTRRWGARPKASDAKWIEYFLNRMQEFPDNRTASFISTAVFYAPNHIPEHQTFIGETKGRITHQLEAPLVHGIPISSCFIPNTADKVYSALTTAEKNQISHRGKAMHQLKSFLCQLN